MWDGRHGCRPDASEQPIKDEADACQAGEQSDDLGDESLSSVGDASPSRERQGDQTDARDKW